jgi:hypothetical protein
LAALTAGNKGALAIHAAVIGQAKHEIVSAWPLRFVELETLNRNLHIQPHAKTNCVATRFAGNQET